MRMSLILLLFFLLSCTKAKENEQRLDDLLGNWELKQVERIQTGQVFGAPTDLFRPYLLYVNQANRIYRFRTNAEYYEFSGEVVSTTPGQVSFQIKEQSAGPQRNISFEYYAGFLSTVSSFQMSGGRLTLMNDSLRYIYESK